jgi:endonuclease/exonuclease/phosphatase family metal-dependent hydrolase
MKLLSWNVAHRVRIVGAQIAEITTLQPDIVALQEVIASTRTILRNGLVSAGLPHVIDSFELALDAGVLTGPRQFGEMIACRWPLRPLAPTDFDVPWPERVLSTLISAPLGTIELHTTHIPPGSTNGWIKVFTLEGIFRCLAIKSNTHRILCGDFNTPKQETLEGNVVTWGTIRGRKKRWDAAERYVLKCLPEYDLGDVYRNLNGYGVTDYSHYSRGRGRRYDHVFASQSLCPTECRYLRSMLDARLSDHAAIEVIFQPIPNPGQSLSKVSEEETPA